MISERTIAAVVERVDIVQLIGETTKLRRAGRSFLGLCPFHKEKTPSFNVNPERGYFHCFGCKEHGNAIDFVRKLEALSFPEAVRMLAERAGVEIEDHATDAERHEAAAAKREREDLYAVNGLAALFFEQSLRGGPGARPHALAGFAVAELARRGLDLDNPAIAAFRIGYAPHAWDGLAVFLARQGVSPVAAERVGLLVPRTSGDGHYDRFRHRLMFAVLDVQGRVIAFSGRALPDPSAEELAPLGMRPWTKPDEKPAKYINSPESPIYTKGEHLFGLFQARQAIRQAGEAVLVEGNFDVVSLHARRIENVVAPLGTAFTETQAKLLRRFAPSVAVFFDGDAAGRKATGAARAPIRTGGLTARAVETPTKADPDDLVQKQGAETVVALIGRAPPLVHRLLNLILREGEVDGAPEHDVAARLRAAQKVVNEAGDDIEQATVRAYAEQLAAGLGMREQTLTRAPRADIRPAASAPRTPATDLALGMLGAVLDAPELVDHPDVAAASSAMEGPAVLGLVALRGGGTPEEIVARAPEEIREWVARRLAAPLYDSADEAFRRFRAFARTARAQQARRAASTVIA